MATSDQTKPASAGFTFAGRLARTIALRTTSRAFLRSFILILIAEAVTILVAWLLLDVNATRWIQQKGAEAARLSQLAASSSDWSRIEQIKKDQDSPLFERYQQRLDHLTQQYFSRKEGSFYIAVIKNGEEYDVAANDTIALDNDDKANQWEIDAYKERKTTYSPRPIVDDTGTYLAAYTPILKNGRVIGLISAEYDEASTSDFRAIIRSTFWLSIAPAILVSLVVAFIIASTFVEPTDVLREIEDTAQSQRARSPAEAENDPWLLLTSKEKEMAEFLRQGRESIKELAESMSVSPETIKQHLKNVKLKTGWSKQALAMQAAARRSASAPTI
jgi:DNA-binding CsgD family transcriptional regulator